MRIPAFMVIAGPLLIVAAVTGYVGHEAQESAAWLFRVLSALSLFGAAVVCLGALASLLASRTRLYDTCNGCGEPFQAEPMHRQCPDCEAALTELVRREQLGWDASTPDSTDYARTTRLVRFPKDAA